jgi:serine/threonine-protein kinase
MTATPFRPPEPGEVLAEKYRVERVLGVGGMGVVVAAHHLQLDERVALKFLLPETTLNAEAVKRFIREARAAVKIKTDHVARVSDVGTLDNGLPYLVMEYLEGADLASELERRGSLGVDEAVELILQASEAIAEAHALGIVHRDLKPANLFLTRRAGGVPWIKVLDFGISKISGGADHDMTRTFAVMGSPLYMSPEQIRASKSVDARADIWALGVIVYELLSGRVPFAGEALPELSVNIAIEPPLAFPPHSPVPSALQAVIFRCLEKDRERRYATVADFAQALTPFANPRALPSIERIRAVGGGAAPWSGSAPRSDSPSKAAPSTNPTLTIAPQSGTGAAFGGTSVVDARTASGAGLGRPIAVTLSVVGALAAAAAVFWLRSNTAVPPSTPDAAVSARAPSETQVPASRVPHPGPTERALTPDTSPEPAFVTEPPAAPVNAPLESATSPLTPPPVPPVPAAARQTRQSAKHSSPSVSQPTTSPATPAPAATTAPEPRPAATPAPVDVFSNRKFD